MGLIAGGPYSLRYGKDFPSSVRLGFVGPSEMIDAGRNWFIAAGEVYCLESRTDEDILTSRHSRKCSVVLWK